MFGSALTTLTGLVDKRFVLNSLAPTLLGALTLVLLWQGTGNGLSAGIKSIDELKGVTASFVAAISVLAMAVFAVVLSSQAQRLASWYCGYSGPLTWGTFGKAGMTYWRREQKKRRAQRGQDGATWSREAWLRVPTAGPVAPTALGTMGWATAQHLKDRFGISGDRTWPLLSTQLSPALLGRVEAAESSIEQLLAFATISAITGMAGAGITAGHRIPLLLSYGVALTGFALAFLFYRASLAAALAWSDLVRSAFELHRLDLLDALHVPRPVNSTQERATWRRLDSVTVALDDRAYALATDTEKADT